MFGLRPAESECPTATRFWRYFGCAAVAALVSASCGSPASTILGDLGQITKNGLMRICSTGDYPPFTYRDPQGQWSGMDIDLAHNLVQRLNVKLDLVQTTWASMMSDLDAKCDVAMGGISITLDRARQALYSNPYLRDGKAAVVRCTDRSKYQTLAAIDPTRCSNCGESRRHQRGLRQGAHSSRDQGRVPRQQYDLHPTDWRPRRRHDHRRERNPLADKTEPSTVRGEPRYSIHLRTKGVLSSTKWHDFTQLAKRVAQHRQQRRHILDHQSELARSNGGAMTTQSFVCDRCPHCGEVVL